MREPNVATVMSVVERATEAFCGSAGFCGAACFAKADPPRAVSDGSPLTVTALLYPCAARAGAVRALAPAKLR